MTAQIALIQMAVASYAYYSKSCDSQKQGHKTVDKMLFL